MENKGKNTRPWDLINPNKDRVPVEIAKGRMDICKKCPQFLKATSQCKECGCIMVLKTKLAESYCPIGQWDKIEMEK